MTRSTNGTLVLRAARRAACLALILPLGALGVAGCFFNDLNDCRLNPMLACYEGSGSGGSGGTGGAPPGCIPKDNAAPVADDCGVFVSSSRGADGNDGSKVKPFATLSQALAKGDGRIVYACAEEFSEPLVIATIVTVYGGLDCAKDWAYVGATTKTKLTADADTVPLHVASSGDAQLEDFQVVAQDAAKDGGSSIAVVAEMGSALTLARSEVQAGNGRSGKPGETPADPVGPSDPDDPTIKGNDGAVACMTMDQQFGGSAKENALCPSGDGGPLGGAGGIGTITNGGDGQAAQGNAQTAVGGVGQPAVDPMSQWSCGVGSGLGGGQSGATGMTGASGAGATALGALSADGYTGESGKVGESGKPGQGGGGGGGAKGKSMCAGASGGGGGAGGCGGQGGLGGQAGGSSIGIVSLGATLGFTDVTIKTGKGGTGGAGGQGQVGGTGGSGGKGGNGTSANLSNACNGGSGGQGGTGGKGGGGRGGHSFGIAFTGAAPDTKAVTFELGTGGPGGNQGEASSSGAAGLEANTQDFGAEGT